MKTKNYRKFYAIIFFSISTVVLFFDFNFNLFGVAHREWFKFFQLDSESFVIGRMVKSRKDGFFSEAGLNGLVSKDEKLVYYEDHPFDFQYEAYLNNLDFGAYSTYNSQIGGQGLLFSLLDRILPFTSRFKLDFFRGLNSFFLALILSIIILWFYFEFGVIVSLMVFFSIFFSQWLVFFARNLWWCTWVFYLPFVMLFFYLKKNETSQVNLFKLGFLVFFTVFIKCFINGFEFITSTIFMMYSPLFYYYFKNKSNFKFFMIFFVIFISSVIAILLASFILCVQISIIKGDIFKGVEHIVYSFQKRTYGNPDLFPDIDRGSLRASLFSVILIYLLGPFLDLNNYFRTDNLYIANFVYQVRFIYLIFLFLFATIFIYLKKEKLQKIWEKEKIFSLVNTTWFSLLSPLSWFVIFKSHSFKHIHMDFIVWQMPFTIFGFGIIGIVVKYFYFETKNYIYFLFSVKDKSR